MIYTKDLRIDYKGGKLLTFEDISIEKGEQWLLKGNSGTGKTTLLHLLSGILSPSSGSITIDNLVISKLRQTTIDKFRAKTIGLIFQKNLFISSLSMYNNLVIAQKLSGTTIDKSYIRKLTDELGISGLSTRKPYELSQGEQQRFSIARALVNQPKVILADEPTSSLDDSNCSRFIDIIINICDMHKVTLAIATHDNRFDGKFNNLLNLNQQ